MTVLRRGYDVKRGDLVKLAELTGRHKAHISRVLRGERKPSRELARLIAAYFHVRAEELFPGLADEEAS